MLDCEMVGEDFMRYQHQLPAHTQLRLQDFRTDFHVGAATMLFTRRFVSGGLSDFWDYQQSLTVGKVGSDNSSAERAGNLLYSAIYIPA